jgi:hypothetical protein
MVNILLRKGDSNPGSQPVEFFSHFTGFLPECQLFPQYGKGTAAKKQVACMKFTNPPRGDLKKVWFCVESTD